MYIYSTFFKGWEAGLVASMGYPPNPASTGYKSAKVFFIQINKQRWEFIRERNQERRKEQMKSRKC